MLTPEVRAGFSDRRRHGPPVRGGALRWVIEIVRRRCPVPPPCARPVASGLKTLICDGARADTPALAATEAARGFGLGNGFAQGEIIDRAI